MLKLPEELRAVKVSADARRTAVMVIDMQNDFIEERGKLYVPRSESLIKPIKSLLNTAREVGATIIYTQDWHHEDDPEFEVWGEHALAGSWGAEIVEELKPKEGEFIVRKPSYDAFYGTPLEHILRYRGLENLILTGVLANICVLHTAGSAAMRGYRLIVPVDCILALNEFDYALSLRQMSFIYKAKLTRSDMIEFG
ncbi:MAG: isochorismatase [Candidatus Wolframiiraptor sp. EX4484-121]|nr:MAG: isochorismatase [Candidatus Wolframiiraptor sp. EX4484-121]